MEFIKELYLSIGEGLGTEASLVLAAVAMVLLLIIKLRKNSSPKSYWLVVVINILLAPNGIIELTKLV